MLVDFIGDLAGLCARDRAEVIPTPAWLLDYLQEPLVGRGLELLSQDRHTTEMTAALFDNQRIVPIEADDSGWSSLLLTINKEASSISTAAGAALVHVLEAGGDLAFHQCDVRGVQSFDDIPAGATLGDRRTFAVRTGETFVLPQNMQAILLEGTSKKVKLLRFNGPVAAPISLAFDPATGRMMSASFSHSEATAKHFFSILLGELTRASPGAGPTIPIHEQEKLADCIDELCDGEVHAYTRWRLAQTMARIRPSSAINHLRTMAAQDLPNLGRQAGAALTKALGVKV